MKTLGVIMTWQPANLHYKVFQLQRRVEGCTTVLYTHNSQMGSL